LQVEEAMKRILVLALLLGGVPYRPVFAQVNASVTGTVIDPSGALIPGVEVSATNVNTGIVNTSLTNEAGSYQLPSLQPGTYKVTASLPGFQTQTYENVQLSQSQQVRLNFQLKVAGQAQAVEVTVSADTVLATTTASVGNVLSEESVRNLPLATRNVIDLIATTPGATSNVTFAGTRSSQVNTTRDGVVVSDGRYMDWNGAFAATYTTPDLVEEVQITTNTVDSEVGRGSGQVRLQTRSGTNQFHGAAFYTNNNSALNTQTFFQNLTGARKTYTNRNQYGARLGGPIKRNKAFFFFLFEGQRYLAKQDTVATVLTPAARQGIFRFLTANAPGNQGGVSRRNGNAFSTTPSVDLAGNILTSANGQPLFLNAFNVFSDVKDPFRTRIDPVWVAPTLLARMPMPNDYTVGDGLNTAGFRWLRPIKGDENATGVTSNSNRDQYNVRLDYQLSSKHKLFGVVSKEKDTGLTPQAGIANYPGGFNGMVERRPDIFSVALTSTLSNSLLNEFRYGLRRTSFYGWGPIHLGCCSGSSDTDVNELARQAMATFPTVNGYLVNVQGGLGINNPIAPYGTGGTRASVSPLWSFSDNVNWTKGVHSFKAGVELIFANSDGWNTGTNDMYPTATLGIGSIAIQGITTAAFPGLNTNDITTAQNLLATLSGSIGTLTQGFIVNSPTAPAFTDYKTTIRKLRDYHQNDWSAFFKDSWKVTKDFTLNLGIRYDKYGTPWLSNGLAARAKGGQAGLFGCSGTDFSVLWNPNVGCDPSRLTTIELVGKNSPHPNLKPYQDDSNNFAPSIGFSWSLPHLKNTVLRGGYGISYTGAPTMLNYDTVTIGAVPGTETRVTAALPNYTDLSSMTLPLTPTSVPFATIPLTDRSVSFNGYDDHRVIPYVQNFNLSIQRDLGANLTLNVSYSGTKGTKLWGAVQLDEVNIFENGILDAFNITRAGGRAPLFDRLLNGVNFPGVGVVNGTTLTGSDALRRSTLTNGFIANGQVAALANFFNTTTAIGGGVRGAIIRNAGLPENWITVNPQFNSVALHGNNDNSTYHSLVTQVRKRFSHGVTAEFAHTWSKSLGNTAVPAGVGTDTTVTARDPRNHALQKGLEAFDVRHAFNTYGSWDLPFGPNRRLLNQGPAFLQRLVEGWQLSGIFNWSTGTPLGFTSTLQTLAAISAVNTPDLVGTLPSDFAKVQVGNGFVQYFPSLTTQRAPVPNFGGDATLPGVFTNQVVVDSTGRIVLQNPAPGTTGNLAQRIFQGPANMRFDAAISKRVRIGESKSFTLRADAVNFLNHPVWGNPNTDINSASFGRITTATGARTITLNARIDF
jgi:hypothetical protein